jgi:purine-binding chemotaxis protein CheW
MSDTPAALPAVGAELLMVQVGDQRFAMDIMTVREIRGWTASTPLPHAPTHVRGMINLRGVILPVVDLAARLGLGETAADASSVVVVTQINGRLVGLLVDAVCDILIVSENMLQAPPDVGAASVKEFVRGIMTIESGIVTLLCLDFVLPTEAMVAA